MVRSGEVIQYWSDLCCRGKNREVSKLMNNHINFYSYVRFRPHKQVQESWTAVKMGPMGAMSQDLHGGETPLEIEQKK